MPDLSSPPPLPIAEQVSRSWMYATGFFILVVIGLVLMLILRGTDACPPCSLAPNTCGVMRLADGNCVWDPQRMNCDANSKPKILSCDSCQCGPK